MSMLKDARDAVVGALVGAGLGGEQLTKLVEDLDQERAEHAMSKESKEIIAREGLADLELAFEDIGWRDLTSYYGIWKFNRATMRRVVALSRIMYVVNPLIKRAVTVQELYVWGAGCRIKAKDDIVDGVLKEFFEDPKNQRVIGQGEEGWAQREREQRIDGNQFFAFFTNPITGCVRVRLLPYDTVEDVIYNPQDNKECWFYKRSMAGLSYLDSDLSLDTTTLPQQGMQILYPDIGWNPTFRPLSFGDTKVAIDWNVRILHVKTGALSSMKFGLPELYSALNWATAYKKILENFATILAAYARIAVKMTGLAGKKGVAAAKSKLNTAISSAEFRDTNPPANTASWMALSGNVDVQPVKTAHSTTAPDEARALRSMVASGADLPEHFFGDSDVGNFATSETLDRPTELKMIARQQMWRVVILQMARFVIEQSALAVEGTLRQAGYRGKLESDRFDRRTLSVTVTPPANGSLAVEVTFPNITERAITDRVRALVNAATLNGRKAEGIFPDRKYLFKLMLEALGVHNVDELVQEYYPKPVPQGFVDPEDDAEDKRTMALAKKATADAAKVAAQASKAQAEKPTPAPAAQKPAAKEGELREDPPSEQRQQAVIKAVETSTTTAQQWIRDVKAAAMKYAGHPDRWEEWLHVYFSDSHAKEVAEVLNIPVEVAQEYCAKQRAILTEQGPGYEEDLGILSRS